MTCWSSLLQSRLDYCCQLWSPCDQASITMLEGLARQFTSHIEGMEGLDYWERMKELHLYSQERRRERYLIIYIWKLALGLVKGFKMESSHSRRRGWYAIPKTIVQEGVPLSVRRAWQLKEQPSLISVPEVSEIWPLTTKTGSSRTWTPGYQRFLTSPQYLAARGQPFLTACCIRCQ